ncbi:MAG TPA: hypothetical protein VMV57_14390 [Terracidiphilus sp.]|nr:hypothetical protein [Terracidiphilus sp.]
MGKAKKHTLGQIVNILRQIEVAVANGMTHPVQWQAGNPNLTSA